MAGRRDYAAEYARRVALGESRGLSRSQVRGHPRLSESHVSGRGVPKYDRRLEGGLKAIRGGKHLDRAAKSAHVSSERLRLYLRQSGVVEKRDGRWQVVEDSRLREVPFYSEGELITPTLTGYEPAAYAGRYMAATDKFIQSNDIEDLRPFEGEGVTDTSGAFHEFETRPNVVYRLSLPRGESYEQMYRIVV